MLRPIAVGVPVSPKKQEGTLRSHSNSKILDEPARTLRSRTVTEAPPGTKSRPVKRVVPLSGSEESDSEITEETRPLRKKNVEKQAPTIALRSRDTTDSKPSPKKILAQEPTREKLERRASDELPLIRLKRLKTNEAENQSKIPVERERRTRVASLNSAPVVEAPKTRRGSIPTACPQAKTPMKRSESTGKELKLDEPNKKEQKSAKRLKIKVVKKNSTYYERLKLNGYISGSKLNIYDDCSNFLPKDIVEAPIFKPTDEEFNNPFQYIQKIAPKAEKFGICKIIPPASFKPSCVLNEDMRFVGYKQHVHKLFDRFGPNVKEYSAIRRHLLTQGIDANQIPTIAGLELDLPMLSAAVAANGGLSKVIEEKKWSAVCDFIRAPKWSQDRSARLDELYIKYLLAYDLLTPEERQKFYEEAESAKEKRFQKRMKNEPVEVEDDPLQEKDECTIKGRSLSLKDFKRLARNASAMFTSDSDSCEAIEARFWRLVETQLQHTCVLIGSVDAGETGCGFPTSKSPLAKHPWNPKVFTNSAESVLRSMSTVIGVTAPILHFGMVFSACCWFRDPHGLPWIEFMHSGSPRVWYGLSVDQESAFRSAVQKLWPGFIQNKRVWLPSDAVMISPRALHEHGIRLSRTVQNPGEFIVVFPRAFTNSISTGYSVSESAYFAPMSWLKTAPQVFADARESCEPTMFSFDRLLVSMVQDSRLSNDMLKEIEPLLEQSVQTELAERTVVEKLKLKSVGKDDPLAKVRVPNVTTGAQWECDICRVSLFYSRVYRQLDDTSYCLKHAAENLQLRRKEVASFVLVISLSKVRVVARSRIFTRLSKLN